MTRSARIEGAGYVAPLLAVMFVAFNAPIAYMLGLGLWDKSGSFTLEHYAGLLEAPVYLKVLGNTMRIALIATLANVAIGYPLALWMRGLGHRARMIALALVVLPFWVSILVRTYAWIVVLGNGGLVNRGLQWSGLTDAPVSFLYNELGVTIGMANVLLPFLVLPLFAAMIRIDDRLMQAAASLGAPPRTIFWKVYFPLTLPGVMAGVVLVFTISLGFFVIPALLGGARGLMLAQLIEFNINGALNWGMASALSTSLLAVTLLLYAIGDRWFNLGAIWGLQR
jgi:ABC-type spermidine/putrescine transport system permease subunit I